MATRYGLPLSLRNLRVALAEAGRPPRVVLDIPTLDLAAGVQLAICGPSGSGKTTLLNILAAIQRPDSGRVRWGDTDVDALTATGADRWRRESLGFVFQEFHLIAGMSASENVLLPLRFDHLSINAAMRHAATTLLDRIGVPPKVSIERLSRGEMQRVAIARALIRAPAIVLADEPTASLDRRTAGTVAELLCRLCRDRGTTLVVVTHDDALADRLDRRVLLSVDAAAASNGTAVTPELSSA